MVSCALRSCTSRSGVDRKTSSGITFHRFPNESCPARRQKWINFVGRVGWKPSKYSVLCNKHFEEKFFDRTSSHIVRLRDNAVPAIDENPEDWVSAVPNMIIEPADTTASESSESDPLAITPEDNLALFGDCSENIEFVVESDVDSDDLEMEDDGIVKEFDEDSNDVETKDDGIDIEMHDLEEEGDIEEIMNRNQISDSSRETLTESQIIIDSDDEVEIKEELEVEVGIESVHGIEKECEPILCEKLENIGQDGVQKKRCYVPDCASESSILNENIYWFNVPTDANLKKIWNICIGRTDKTLTYGDVVCHKHFSEKDIIRQFTVKSKDGEFIIPYKKPKLRQGAVPCIKFHEQCCVPTCRRTTGKMYCFPVLRNSDFHLWIYMVKNPILKKLKMKEVLKYRICDSHFDSDCFDDDFLLKRTAAPTLHLPENYTFTLANIKPISEKEAKSTLDNVLLICAHGECPNRSNSGAKLFRFPMVADRCIAWLKACGRENLISSPLATLRKMSQLRLAVCEDHFDFQDFDANTDTLKPDAIPKPYQELSLLLRKSKAFSAEKDGEKVYHYLPTWPKAFVGICCYKGCQSKQSGDNPFFSFPSETERAEKWLTASGLLKRTQNLTNMKICSKHFDKDMFDVLNRLKNDAVPISYTVYKEMEDIKKAAAVNSSTSIVAKEPQNNEHSPTTTNSNIQNVKEQQSIESKPKTIICCAVENCRHYFNARYIRGNNHRFPNPVREPERFNIWLLLIANPKLKDLSHEEIYTKYLVCVRHFETHFYQSDGKSTQLSQEAVPTENLTVDNQWFYTSEYYKTRLQNYFDDLATKGSPEDGTIQWKEDVIQDLEEVEDKTRCVLEKDRIRFPGMGHYLYMGRRANNRKVPYNVYNYFNTGYGLNKNVEFGENIRIHTAIIIDDDDDCERQVLQQLLDKRRKHS